MAVGVITLIAGIAAAGRRRRPGGAARAVDAARTAAR